MADYDDDDIRALTARAPLAGTHRMGELEMTVRAARYLTGATDDDGKTCCDIYCQAERPPEGAELSSGWYTVGSDDTRMVFCPAHGYAFYLQDKRDKARETFERWRAEKGL